MSAAGMISGRGRGKIRPPRRTTGNHTPTDFDTQWNILREALTQIHRKDASKLSFEQLYRASYKVVLKKQGDTLYDKVKEFEESWFREEVMPVIEKLITGNLINIAVNGLTTIAADERRMTGEVFLKALRDKWEDHTLCMNMTTDIMMYMDRVYCADNRKASIYTTAMGMFRKHILRSQLNASELITFDIVNAVILDQVGMERDGDVINKTLIRSVVNTLEGLYEGEEMLDDEKLYVTVFEPAFLSASQLFYQNECQNLLREADASAWLCQTQKRLTEEQDRCATTLSVTTEGKIARVVEKELISNHLAEFLAMEGSGLKAMIEHDRFDDLTILYSLMSRVDPLKEPLKNALQSRVIDMGCDINKTILDGDFGAVNALGDEAEEDGGERPKKAPINKTTRQTAAAIKWVDDILALKDKFDNLWKRCFMSDVVLETALTRSFSDFINMFRNCSEYVSLFIDDNLRRGIKGKTEAEIDVVLDKATTLLRYIQEKDMFERYYKKHLARRLIQAKSQSADVEKQMISRMKQELGSHFTHKLEGMFKDMALSEDLTTDYKAHIESLGDMDRRNIDLSATVLSTNFWPMEIMGGPPPAADGVRSRVTCSWPGEIQTLQESFKKFYLKERNGRMLTWMGSLGSADIKCFFPKVAGESGPLSRDRRYEINITTYGMLVLLLFNDLPAADSLSFEEIQQRTNIPEGQLAKILLSISVPPKFRLLVKDPPNKEAPKPLDTFRFNSAFVSKTIKIRIQVMGGGGNKVEDDTERKETDDNINRQREFVIDTAIVRIMKARKTFAHTQLLSEVITQLAHRFAPDIGMMKKRVESLIEREYLERVEDARVATYNYLA